MPRSPRPAAPTSNGRHQPVTITLTGDAAEKLTHLAERLGVTPETAIQDWIDTQWPPVPTDTAGS